MQKGKNNKAFVRDILSVRMNVWEWGSFEAEPSQGTSDMHSLGRYPLKIFYAINSRASLTDAHDSDAIKTQFLWLLRDYC